MAGTHPEIELIGHLRDELGPAERARIETHLAACAECRRTATAFQDVLTDLRARESPAIHLGDWMAELRARLEFVRSSPPRRRLHPAAIALASAAAGALI